MPGGVNFSVFSRHATGIELLLFDGVDDTKPVSVVRLDPTANRTYYYWHAFVPTARPGQLYGYRVEGPFDPASGMRFDPAKLVPRQNLIRLAQEHRDPSIRPRAQDPEPG